MSQDLKPIYILSGFLGSGKTTLLNQLLKQEAFANTLVIVNEFGEIALDHLLIEKSSDTILELSNGCLCCSIRGELVDTLLELDPNQFDRIIIETTGIADPLPIFQSLAFHPTLAGRYRPAEIITVYDCLRQNQLIDAHEEAIQQLTIADAIVLTKLDLIQNNREPAKQIATYNQTAQIFTSASHITPKRIANRTSKSDHKPHGHGSKYKSLVLKTENTISIAVLSGLLHYLCNSLGNDLLRIKGFACVDKKQSVLVQVSGTIIHDFEPSPDTVESQGTNLVVIFKNTDPARVQSVFDSFMNNLALDTADQKSVMDNPLSVPGFKF